MGKRDRRRRPARRPPRKPLNLGGPDTVTFYVVRFEAKVPAEMREGTTAPEWIRRDSPPTLDEDEARAAYRAVVDELMTQDAGIRRPQLLVRTVTEAVLRDYEQDRAADIAADVEHLESTI